jgi:tetratricopeptide (TPR) repeat protein
VEKVLSATVVEDVIHEQEIKQLMRDPSSIHEQRDSLSKKRSPRYLDEIEQSLFEEDLVKNLVTHQDYFLPLKNIVIQNYTLRQLLDLCIGYYEIGLYTQVIDLAKQIRQSLSVDEKEVKSAAIMDSILSLEAQSHFDLKQFSESISLLQTCLAQKNQNTARAHPEIYYLLAKSYLAWGQQESALYWFHKLSEDYPEESDYRDSKEILSRIRGMKQSYD